MPKNNLENSFKILKQTVPLLLKHKMPAVPVNYALWYTYAANENPELNSSVDTMLEQFKGMSDARVEELYRNHVADEQEVSPWQLRQTVEAMLVEMSQTVKDTRTDTNGFRDSMDGCLDDLAKVEKEGWSVDEVMSVVRNLVNEAQEIRQTTLSFSAALSNAEKEIAQLREELQQTQQYALHDSLTGLCNRRFFDSELSSMLHNTKLCLIIIDVDHFKKFNDTHGHLMGDRVLKAVAKKLQQSCRDGAQCYRFGGEEFAVLLPNMDMRRALHNAEVMRRAVEKIQLKDKKTGKTIDGIAASFGVAQAQPKMQPSDLIELADQQLYKAKQLGRNRVMPMH